MFGKFSVIFLFVRLLFKIVKQTDCTKNRQYYLPLKTITVPYLKFLF